LRSAVAILVLGPLGQVDVTDNSIRRNENVPDEGEDYSNWWALQIIDAPGSHLSSGVVTMRTEDFSAHLGKENAYITPVTPGVVSVRGNSMDYYGKAEAVDIEMDGRCAFNDNRGTSLVPTDQPVVVVEASAIIMNANYLFGPLNANRKDNNDTHTGAGGNGLDVAELSINGGSFTVVGNITSAPILVDGQPLGPPWDALNVVST